jgi:hypothetical protein
MNEPFKQYPDAGNLHATLSKKTEKSPDYFGEIAINLKDMTNVRVEDGLTIFKLSGWKRHSKTSGKTYLALSVSRFVAEGSASPKAQDKDEDVPF